MLLRIRTISNKSCGETRNRHRSVTFFPEIMPFMRWCGKI